MERKSRGVYNLTAAKACFSELVRKARLGEEVIIAKNNKPVAKLVALNDPRPRIRGSARGQVLAIAPDFDAPLPELRDYP